MPQLWRRSFYTWSLSWEISAIAEERWARMDSCILAHRSLAIAPYSSILDLRCTNKRLRTVLKMALPKQLPVQVRSEETTNKILGTHPISEEKLLWKNEPTTNLKMISILFLMITMIQQLHNVPVNAVSSEDWKYVVKLKMIRTGLNEMSLQNNDKKVNILTGLATYSILMAVFHFVAPYLKHKSGLTLFQQHTLALINLRLNLSFDFLAYYFGIDSPTVSKLFKHSISVS